MNTAVKEPTENEQCQSAQRNTTRVIRFSFHMIMIIIAIYLANKCTIDDPDKKYIYHIIPAILCPQLYILYMLIFVGTTKCNI